MIGITHHGAEAQRDPRGRPKGTKKRDSRTEVVKVRVHPREKEELQRRAAARDMSVSEYLLVCSLSGVDNP